MAIKVKEMPDFEYHFADGNTKLGKGIRTWSTSYGSFERTEVIDGWEVTVTGTCGNCVDCEDYCYVEKAERMYEDTRKNHVKNTFGLRTEPDKVFAMLDGQLTRSRKITVVRINQSGEIESADELFRWLELAMKHQAITFYLYTKMYSFAEQYIKAGLPKNMFILYSVWGKNGVEEFKRVERYDNVKAYIYDDGECKLVPTTQCMAYVSGKMNHDITCDKCRKCFTNSGKKLIGCKPH